MSSGMLFVAFSLARPGTIAAGLYYLPHSCFAAAAMFLIAHIVQRERGRAGDRVLPTAPPMPAVTGVLYMVAALLLIGLPPLSGFIGKFLLLGAVPAADTGWVYATVLGSGLLALIGLSRTGSRLFWRTGRDEPRDPDDDVPQVRPQEIAATVILLGYGVAMSLAPSPVLRYTGAAAEQLLSPQDYVRQVRETAPRLRAP